MEKPLVSICIPAYNNADYITETMDSIMNQTYPNIELIVVDDGSKDSTWEVINEYKKNYEKNELTNKPNVNRKIRLYKNEKNLGMSGNWNHSLELCTGKYLKLVCADDLMDPNLTETEVSIMEQDEEVLCVSSDTRFVDLNGDLKGYYRRYHKNGKIDGKKAVKYSAFTRNYLGAPAANLFRKEIYDKIGGFDSSFVFIVDYDFYMRIYCSGKVYILHDKPLNYFRIRNDSNTGQVLGGGKTKTYVAEHRHLMEKAAPVIGLSKFQITISVFIRRIMCVLGALYLKLNVPKE
ncbi:glycosyltransferase family 2 protein [Lachnospira multipara]|uniref:Glycosyl transferase family 2 n=1 Tax=Lachnospira multipara TaxID=28051 RepID=A0A1H5XF51_9FIRM|nr:glycosyltransferase [Lachnospira multipara]SEG09836.1 Glycosyl transferase family 2 [Lachnospira multipara]